MALRRRLKCRTNLRCACVNRSACAAIEGMLRSSSIAFVISTFIRPRFDGLLVLSACETGVAAGATADVPPGDDWVGLVNAFLFAGAANILGKLWPVQDASTARLMDRFYQELSAGRSEAEALALAQRALLHERARAHPFFWAGFTLVRGQ